MIKHKLNKLFLNQHLSKFGNDRVKKVISRSTKKSYQSSHSQQQETIGKTQPA